MGPGFLSLKLLHLAGEVIYKTESNIMMQSAYSNFSAIA